MGWNEFKMNRLLVAECFAVSFVWGFGIPFRPFRKRLSLPAVLSGKVYKEAYHSFAVKLISRFNAVYYAEFYKASRFSVSTSHRTSQLFLQRRVSQGPHKHTHCSSQIGTGSARALLSFRDSSGSRHQYSNGCMMTSVLSLTVVSLLENSLRRHQTVCLSTSRESQIEMGGGGGGGGERKRKNISQWR